MNETIEHLPNGDFKVVKTPARGPIDHPSPRANTQQEVQESWAKAKMSKAKKGKSWSLVNGKRVWSK
jgi:hypothetical protein